MNEKKLDELLNSLAKVLGVKPALQGSNEKFVDALKTAEKAQRAAVQISINAEEFQKMLEAYLSMTLFDPKGSQLLRPQLHEKMDVLLDLAYDTGMLKEKLKDALSK